MLAILLQSCIPERLIVVILPRFLPFCLLLATVSAAESVVHPTFTPEQLEFYQQTIQPILAEHCYKCHGGGEANASGHVKVKSGLQVISRLGLVQGGEHGPAFNAAAPMESLLLRAVSYDDEHLKMPPSGKLGEDERQALQRWVGMGLPWNPEDINKLVPVIEEVHTSKGPDNTWTYEPLRAITPPTIAGIKHPIDALLTAKLRGKNLTLAPPATRQALIRRAYYGLTGLPPTPQQVADFIKDPDPNAFAKLTDTLLDSNHYGEKYARHWLDLVRYAESNGFERDGFKENIWRYRQWVIDAFNDDIPYDQFIRDQLAGDEITPVSKESLIATGYWNLMQWDDEPADKVQHEFDILDDNIRVTTETFLGMTVGCARCHNHKVDPISQKDYYSIMSFMRGLNRYDNGSRQRDVTREISGEAPPAAPGRPATGATYQQHVQAQILEMEKLARQRCQEKLQIPPPPDLGKVLIADSRQNPQKWDYTTTKPPQDWAMPGFSPSAYGWISGSAGFGAGGAPGVTPRTNWNTSDLWVRGYFQLTSIPDILNLTIYHDEDAEIFLNGQKVNDLPSYLTGYITIPLGLKSKAACQTGKNVLAIQIRQTTGGSFFDAGLSIGDATIASILKNQGDKIFTPEERTNYEQLIKQVGVKRGRAQPSPNEIKAQIAVEVGPKAPDSFIQIRGNPHVPGEKVEPAFPVVFKNPPPTITPSQKSSGRRQALAEWIASPENPRTARIIVNRVWQWHFGRGLCTSSSDFGKLGSGVTHPELLDWLAAKFIESGWSFKELHRIIMSSQAYQQAALYGPSLPEGHKVDPANTLWWRFDMRRLSSEEIRDSLLSVSGTLNPAYGGESFFEEMPEEVLATTSTKGGAWGNSPPEERTRRSIYMKSKRALSHPLMTDFDQADTDNPCPSRFSTTVPTQALNFLNSKFLDDKAALFARRLETDHPNDLPAQIRSGLQIVTQRAPRPEELKQLLDLHQTFLTKHQNDPQLAFNRVCLTLLNLNEFLFLD